MSKSAVRRLRQIKRRIGKFPERLVVGIVVAGDKVIFHYKQAAPLVRTDPMLNTHRIRMMNRIHQELSMWGFVKQHDIPVWVNPKATMEDLVRMSRATIVKESFKTWQEENLWPKDSMVSKLGLKKANG